MGSWNPRLRETNRWESVFPPIEENTKSTSIVDLILQVNALAYASFHSQTVIPLVVYGLNDGIDKLITDLFQIGINTE